MAQKQGISAFKASRAMHRRLGLLLLLIVAVHTIAIAQTRPLQNPNQSPKLPDLPDPPVNRDLPDLPVIQLVPHHERFRSRMLAAAQESVAMYGEWLGPRPTRVTITDASLPASLWLPEAAMDLESHVAYEIAREWLRQVEDDPRRVSVRDGLAWYLQSRVVERMFNARYLRLAHSADRIRYFGGSVSWAFPSLPLSRWTAGLGREDFLRGSPAARRARGALAFGTLERYLGWPVWHGALRALGRRINDGPLTFADVSALIGAAAGQELSWFFTPAFDPAIRFDYGVEELPAGQPSPTCATTPCDLTRITVYRRGSGQFTGTSRGPVGPFEAGDALELRVHFADARIESVRWDGRSETRTVEFESEAPAVIARLDPERTLLLDTNYLDEARKTTSTTNVPITKWVARWLVWLQDAMLAYGSVL